MAKCADYSGSSCNTCAGSKLSISNPIFTKGVNPSESAKIDWESILPKIESYSLTTKTDNNYEKAPRQLFRQNVANINDIIESNQKRAIPGYQSNFTQNNIPTDQYRGLAA